MSPAAVRIIDAFDAAGFDLVLLETVGTGQNEIDIAAVSNVAVVIAAPGLGDAFTVRVDGDRLRAGASERHRVEPW